MSTLARHLAHTDLAERVFSDAQLHDRIGGSDARRYGLVNRALKDGSLIRLKRGLYMLSSAQRDGGVHPFAAAQAFEPGSYVSFETALSFHAWIPEAVFTTASVSPGPKTIHVDAPILGAFSFHPLAICDYQFLRLVARHKFGALTALVAEPLRALMDIVALRKLPWNGLDWLTEGLRIEKSTLASLKQKDFAALSKVYKHKSANHFLRQLNNAVASLRALQ